MSRRLRLLGVSAIVAGVAGAAIPATALSRSRHHDERLDLGRPARLAARQGLPQAVSGPREVQARPGRLGRRRGRRRRRPRHDRQLLARSEGLAIRAASSSTRSPRTRSASSPTRPTRWRTCRRTRSRRSSPAQVRNWEDVPGAGTTGLDQPRRPHRRRRARRTRSRRSSWARRPCSAAPRRRPPTASSSRPCQSDKNAIGYVSQDFVKGTNAVAYQGVGCNAGRTPSPASTAACATSGWSPAGTRAWPARCRSSSTGSRPRERAQKIVATHWVPLK